MTDEELIQEAIEKLKAAGQDIDMDKVDRMVAALKDIQEIVDGKGKKKDDKPEEADAAVPAAASQEPAEEPVEASSEPDDADAVEASAEPEAAVEEPETVDASTQVDAAEPPMEPSEQEPDEAALEGEAMAAVGIIAESSGMSEAEVVAGLRDYADAVAGVLSGESGMPAEQPMASKGDDTALKASKARTEALEARLKQRDAEIAKVQEQVAELQLERYGREVDDAVKAGHILEQHRPIFLSLAKSDPDEFRAQLETAQEKPAIPTGQVYTPANDKAPEVRLSQLEGDPDFERLVRSLRSAPAPGGKGRMTEQQARIAAAKTYNTEAH